MAVDAPGACVGNRGAAHATAASSGAGGVVGGSGSVVKAGGSNHAPPFAPGRGGGTEPTGAAGVPGAAAVPLAALLEAAASSRELLSPMAPSVIPPLPVEERETPAENVKITTLRPNP
ncbi:unnamed protein product, partial [Pylaiella littoralis]